MADLQVLIAAYGSEALEKIASLTHAPYPGVEYLVSWQKYDRARIPATITERNDFHLFFENSIGLCNNRNALLQKASAPLIVISDDDLLYTPDHFKNILRGFNNNPDAHLLAFQYHSDSYPKNYPAESFVLDSPPKNYFVTSMELAFNLSLIKKDFGNAELLKFHPAFGVNGSLFGSGEEDILIHRLLKNGCKGVYVPSPICVNTDSTTSERIGSTEGFIETKGAVISYIKPSTEKLRMISHALRANKCAGRGHIPFVRYCRWWRNGVSKAKQNKVFENY